MLQLTIVPVLSDVAVIFFQINRNVNSKWQLLDYVTIAFSERYFVHTSILSFIH